MKILQVHNAYQHSGGEDTVVEAEAQLLRAHGHKVISMRRGFEQIAEAGLFRAATEALWSKRSQVELRDLVHDEKPDVLHAHNTFPLVSPSVFWEADQARLPVVLTLHNFRLVCPQAQLLRDGAVCEKCVGRTPLPAVIHGCYRDSRRASTVLAGMLMLHRGLGTWVHKVDRYIALNDFCREKFVQGGLPAARIMVKPNFVDAVNTGPAQRREGLVFVGRLSHEKGIEVLARAAAAMPPNSIKVAGAGPDGAALAQRPSAVMLGHLQAAQVRTAMAQAHALIFPSIWYETFGMVILEAFATGTAVIASRLGAALNLVTEGETGLLFEPGNADDLAKKMLWAMAHPEEMAAMGERARALALARFTPSANHLQLMAVYREAQRSRLERNAAT